MLRLLFLRIFSELGICHPGQKVGPLSAAQVIRLNAPAIILGVLNSLEIIAQLLAKMEPSVGN